MVLWKVVWILTYCSFKATCWKSGVLRTILIAEDTSNRVKASPRWVGGDRTGRFGFGFLLLYIQSYQGWNRNQLMTKNSIVLTRAALILHFCFRIAEKFQACALRVGLRGELSPASLVWIQGWLLSFLVRISSVFSQISWHHADVEQASFSETHWGFIQLLIKISFGYDYYMLEEASSFIANSSFKLSEDIPSWKTKLAVQRKKTLSLCMELHYNSEGIISVSTLFNNTMKHAGCVNYCLLRLFMQGTTSVQLQWISDASLPLQILFLSALAKCN